MESFTIKSELDFIEIYLSEIFGYPDTTCHWGGYDSESELRIQSGDFQVNSKLYTSTGDIYSFYTELKECNEVLKGSATYKSYEGNLSFTCAYDNGGHVKVSGNFTDHMYNKLQFEFNTDQTYVTYTVNQLKVLAEKYGGLTGI